MENEVISEKPKKEISNGMIWLIVISVLVVAAIFFLMFWMNKETAKAPEVTLNQNEKSETVNESSDQIVASEQVDDESDQAVAKKTGSEITSVDNAWNKYTSYDLGFSINAPKQAASGYASCEFNSGENSYRAKAGMIPIKTFENISDGVIYIAPEYFYRLGGEKQDQNGISSYSTCNKIQNSVQEMENSTALTEINYWKISTDSVQNDSEVENFLKSIFGTACKLGDKTQTSVAGVYDIKIGGITDLDGACPMNAAYIFKYAPSKKLVATWTTGQAYNFYTSVNYIDAYDEQMINSFSFN